MIEFKDVSKHFSDGFEALKNINLKVNKGELLTLIGPSGCGKTTTMRMINRLIEPTKGQVFIENENIKSKDPVQLRRNIGYVIQQIGLMPHMTIEDNIALVPKLKKWSEKRYLEKTNDLLEIVDLDPKVYKKRYPSELSGGEQQRIGVIRALAGEPNIILMDEPFSALDPISREQLQDELVKLQEEIKKTIVFVTHDMDEALKIASRIAIMRDGEIIQLDIADRILRYPRDKFVRDFIGEERLTKELGDPIAYDLMQKRVVTIEPHRGLAEGYKVIKEQHVDNLYVINKDRMLLGLVTVKNLMDNYHNENKKIADIMQNEFLSVHLDEPMSKIVDMFANTEINALPVVSKRTLKGLITKSSIIRGIAEWESKKEVHDN